MISTQDTDRVIGATAYDSNGDKVGKVDQLYLDDQTNEPSWVTVNTGLFGTSQSFVPLEGSSFDGDDLRLGHSKDKIKDAPRIDVDQHLEPSQEDELYRYYGIGAGAGYGTGTAGTMTSDQSSDAQTSDVRAVRDTGTGLGTDADRVGDTGVDVTGEASVTASEERLRADTRTEEAGRARLRKYTTTETETVSVPVTKEKLTVERTPVTGDAVTDAPLTDTDEVEEVTLREERPVVGKETVATEQVSIGKEEVTEQEQVSAEVRKEHVEVDVDGDLEEGRGGTTR